MSELAMPRHLIALASGGTGGHMFPAQALADQLTRQGFAVVLVTDRRGQAFTVPGGAIEVHRIRASGLGDRSIAKKILGVLELGLGVFDARHVLRQIAPRVVVGFGGYASVPTLVAATRLGLPTVLHEQNAVLGRANRLLAPRVSRIATSFETVSGIKPADRMRTVLTGNPVREAVARLAKDSYPAPKIDGPITILITGGSQGARVFGRVVPAAVKLLPEPARRRLRIQQQCRHEDIEEARRLYAELDVRAELATFFGDLPERLAKAQLVICRSGASTVAELTAAGRPGILVPYPYHSDDHQGANAQALENAGAAWLMREPGFTAEALAARLEPLLATEGRLAEMAAKAKALAHIDAAERLAAVVAELALSNGNHHTTREKAA